jgi:predicted Zn-dependent protease
MSSIEKSNWQITTRLLRQARTCLPSSPRDQLPGASNGRLRGSLVEFDEFLNVNELELAWDALAAVAKRAKAGSQCWALLAQAAIRMGLTDRALIALQKLVKAQGRPTKAAS